MKNYTPEELERIIKYEAETHKFVMEQVGMLEKRQDEFNDEPKFDLPSGHVNDYPDKFISREEENIN